MMKTTIYPSWLKNLNKYINIVILQNRNNNKMNRLIRRIYLRLHQIKSMIYRRFHRKKKNDGFNYFLDSFNEEENYILP
jgi:hypothetical protein